MSQTKLLLEIHDRNLSMLQSTLADWSDADMLVRPAPAANHAAWQLGHLCESEVRMMKAVQPDFISVLPADFAGKFSRETTSSDDAKFFPTKAELLDAYVKGRAATTALIKGMPEESFSREIPSPFKKDSTTTVGFMFHMPVLHTTMHIGQFQVIRRVLGKPVLF